MLRDYGAFARHGSTYFEAGLMVTPTRADDCKRPILTGYNKHPLGPDAITQLSIAHPDANLAILVGASRLNIADVDEPGDKPLADALARFGDTPIIARTGGRGGFQLWYRASPDIRPHDFRNSEGLPLEIKADGNIAVAPPSINAKTGRRYEFIRGSLDDIDALQRIKPGSVPIAVGRTRGERKTIAQGHRHKWLLSTALYHVSGCNTEAELACILRERADEWCDQHADPVGDAEIADLARWAFIIQREGRNWVGREPRHPVMEAELLACGGSHAFTLLAFLRIKHGARSRRGESFALAVEAMVEANCIPWFTAHTYRAAIAALLASGQLVRVRQGGRGLHDPSLYRLP
jgi:Bifunctional DNA primase/polymerase, N-terminal